MRLFFKRLFCKHIYTNAYMKNSIGIHTSTILRMDICKRCKKVKIEGEVVPLVQFNIKE
jgi:hypothetical protein